MTNGHGIQIYQIGHDMVIGQRTAKERVMAKSNGANGQSEQIEVQINGIKLTIDAPIPNRPTVFRITANDGRKMIMGDYGTFNAEEGLALRSVIEPEKHNFRQYLEADEKEQFAQAEADLADARTAHEYWTKAVVGAEAEYLRYQENHNGKLDHPDIAAHLAWLDGNIEDAKRKNKAVASRVQEALASFNNMKHRLHRLARVRMPDYDPPTFKTAPAKEDDWRALMQEARQ